MLVEREGIRILVQRGAHGATKVIYGFPPDYAEMRFWAEVLRDGDLFVDVGANVGLYSLWAASLGADVIAFEPSSDSFGSLQDNIALNKWDIDARKQAVGAEQGLALLTLGSDSLNRLLDSPQEAGAWEEVPVVTLDSVITRPVRGLKIDVEGFEAAVLVGAQALLSSQQIDFIQFEWNGLASTHASAQYPSAIEILRGHNYRLKRLGDSGIENISDAIPEPGSDIFAFSPRVSAQSRHAQDSRSLVNDPASDVTD